MGKLLYLKHSIIDFINKPFYTKRIYPKDRGVCIGQVQRRFCLLFSAGSKAELAMKVAAFCHLQQDTAAFGFMLRTEAALSRTGHPLPDFQRRTVCRPSVKIQTPAPNRRCENTVLGTFFLQGYDTILIPEQFRREVLHAYRTNGSGFPDHFGHSHPPNPKHSFLYTERDN